MVQDIFCKIIKGEIKSKPIYKDRDFLVVKDINPQAPVHLLIVTKKHFADMNDFKKTHSGMLGRGLLIAEKISKKVGLKNGYRIIINRGPDSQRGVPHFHMHVLGGKKLGSKIIK
jgi:histidine triad (HIT) family protein